MDAEACQKALANELKQEFGVEYKKNMEGLFSLIDSRRQDAAVNAERLARHHKSIGNDRPSTKSPGTKVPDIFDELGAYLGEGI